MAKEKIKKKKKYVPRMISLPKLIVAIQAFAPLEKALDAIIKNEFVEVDSNGVYIYFTEAGEPHSLEKGLYVYTRLVEIYGIRNNKRFDLSPLWGLRETILNKEPFDEEEIEAAKKTLDLCRQVVCKIPHSETRDILATVRTNLALEKLESAEGRSHAAG